MPVWHEETRELRESGKLRIAGVIQEQHPDRCALFMQWKQLDFPVMVDSLNLLEVPLVPIFTLVDEHGIVRKTGVRRLEDVLAFVEQDFDAPEELPPAEEGALFNLSIDEVEGALGSPQEWSDARNIEIADTTFRRAQMASGPVEFSRWLELAIASYERVIDPEASRGALHFKLGVAYRARYESEQAQPRDFQKAIDHWLAAREKEPNQYIWRRRVQQYGPRLDKPYSFYDWVEEARSAIRARGEEPLELRIEPRGSELADAGGEFESTSAGEDDNPDPDGRITRDREQFIGFTGVVVPHTDAERVRGGSARVHLHFEPLRIATDPHWNNEAEPMTVWIEQPRGYELSQQRFATPNAEAAASSEQRSVELEIRPRGETPDAPRADALRGYALYNVCEGEAGLCVYRRLDFELPLDALGQ